MKKENVVKEIIKCNDISTNDILNTLKIAVAAQIDINNDLTFAIKTLKDMAFDCSDRINVNKKNDICRFLLLLGLGGAYAIYNERRYNKEHPQI